ncbi:hypothetical protein ACGFIV_15525 [Sphaerisporangium sp. NPDC049003]|uniref:amidohydrolase family protein n=1 Tax=Sphaerisporangium sp. NPDC049003 TaxID=3364517 RepID=UPI00371C2BDA
MSEPLSEERTLPAVQLDPHGGQDRPVTIGVAAGGTVSLTPGPWTPGEEVAHWVIPGVADAHVHVTGMPQEAAAGFTAAGVLTVRDLGGKVAHTRAWGGAEGPHVVSFGGQLDQAPLHPHLSPALGATGIRHFGEIAEHVSDLTAGGAAGMKLYYGFPPELVEPAVRAAHEAGLRVACHLGTGTLPGFSRIGAARAVEAGVDSIEHIHSLTADLLPPDLLDAFLRDIIDTIGAAFGRVFTAWSRIDVDGDGARRLIDAFLRRGAVLVPTLAPFALMATEEAGTGLVGIFSRQREVDRHVLDAGKAAMLEMVKVMHEAGVAVALGTDSAHGTGVAPGGSTAHEIRLLMEAGLGEREVLRMTCPSSAVADRLGLPGTGSWTGTDKSFVVLSGRTLREAVLAWNVAMVVRAGHIVNLAPDAPFVTVSPRP